jgi:hypothetical protein
MAEPPRGTATFLFTDIEGSTPLLHELGDAPLRDSTYETVGGWLDHEIVSAALNRGRALGDDEVFALATETAEGGPTPLT